MARTAAAAIDQFLLLLRDATTGFPAQLQSIASRDGVFLRPISLRSTFQVNAPADLMDQNRDAEYPQLFVFAEQVENQRREKFSVFSGTVRLAAEVRITSDAPERLEADLHRYTEALINVLDAAEGEWAPGIIFSGRYIATYGAVRVGAENFLQSARVTFDVDQFVTP